MLISTHNYQSFLLVISRFDWSHELNEFHLNLNNSKLSHTRNNVKLDLICSLIGKFSYKRLIWNNELNIRIVALYSWNKYVLKLSMEFISQISLRYKNVTERNNEMDNCLILKVILKMQRNTSHVKKQFSFIASIKTIDVIVVSVQCISWRIKRH